MGSQANSYGHRILSQTSLECHVPASWMISVTVSTVALMTGIIAISVVLEPLGLQKNGNCVWHREKVTFFVTSVTNQLPLVTISYHQLLLFTMSYHYRVTCLIYCMIYQHFINTKIKRFCD